MKQDVLVNFKISNKLKEKLMRISEEKDRSMSATIRRAISEYIKARERKVLEIL